MNRLSSVLVVGLIAGGLLGCSLQKEDQIAKGFQSKDPKIRMETAEQLAECGNPRALQLLELQRDDPDFQVRDKVREAIAKINKQTFMK